MSQTFAIPADWTGPVRLSATRASIKRQIAGCRRFSLRRLDFLRDLSGVRGPRPATRGRFAISSVATVHAVSIAVFGGATQLMVTWIIHLTGDTMVPAFYWLAGSLVALSAKMMILESAPARLPRQARPRL